MVRTPSFDKSGLKKGTWTPEEDRKLIAYVTRYGCWNWRQLPRFAGLARCGKSCRLRWMNYLRPNIKRGNYTPEEEDTIIRLHKKMGNRWSAIAAHLPGRTDNEIKNHWHTTLKRRLQHHNLSPSVITSTENSKASKQSKDNTTCQSPEAPTSQILDSSALSPQSSSSCVNTTTSPEKQTHESDSIMESDFSFLDDYAAQPVSTDFWAHTNMGDIYDDIFSVPCDVQTIHPIDPIHKTPAFDYSLSEAAIEDLLTQPYMPDVSHVAAESKAPLVTDLENLYHPLYAMDLWSQSDLCI